MKNPILSERILEARARITAPPTPDDQERAEEHAELLRRNLRAEGELEPEAEALPDTPFGPAAVAVVAGYPVVSFMGLSLGLLERDGGRVAPLSRIAGLAVKGTARVYARPDEFERLNPLDKASPLVYRPVVERGSGYGAALDDFETDLQRHLASTPLYAGSATYRDWLAGRYATLGTEPAEAIQRADQLIRLLRPK